MFLAHLGLQTAEGIGMVVGDVATGVTLGGCKPEYRHNLWMCSHGNVTSKQAGNPEAFTTGERLGKGAELRDGAPWAPVYPTVHTL